MQLWNPLACKLGCGFKCSQRTAEVPLFDVDTLKVSTHACFDAMLLELNPPNTKNLLSLRECMQEANNGPGACVDGDGSSVHVLD